MNFRRNPSTYTSLNLGNDSADNALENLDGNKSCATYCQGKCALIVEIYISLCSNFGRFILSFNVKMLLCLCLNFNSLQVELRLNPIPRPTTTSNVMFICDCLSSSFLHFKENCAPNAQSKQVKNKCGSFHCAAKNVEAQPTKLHIITKLSELNKTGLIGPLLY